MKKQLNIAVIVINWNGKEDSLKCISALQKQTTKHSIIAVDNGSSDNFASIVESQHKDIVLLKNNKNLGFDGGVNTGIRYALDNSFDYVALINNDATPEKNWLEELYAAIRIKPEYGIATGKLLKTDGLIDSTGDFYTIWGLAYPRGREEKDKGQYEKIREVFGASGGASLYRCEMLKEIGLFDENFFAYYEDVDISFRAQLTGWKVIYTPKAIAHHKVGATSSRMKNGFTTYMTIKNLPWLMWKNVPTSLLPKVFPRFFIAHLSIILSALSKGKFIPVFKGLFVAFILFPKKLIERYKIQKNKRVSVDYINSILIQDLPPSSHKLKKVRSLLHIKH